MKQSTTLNTAKAADSKASFVFYREWAEILMMMSEESRIEILTALMEYISDGTVNEQLISSGSMYVQMIRQIGRDTEKYRSRCERNADNARHRWAKSAANDDDECSETVEDVSAAEAKAAAVDADTMTPSEPVSAAAEADTLSDNVRFDAVRPQQACFIGTGPQEQIGNSPPLWQYPNSLSAHRRVIINNI